MFQPVQKECRDFRVNVRFSIKCNSNLDHTTWKLFVSASESVTKLLGLPWRKTALLSVTGKICSLAFRFWWLRSRLGKREVFEWEKRLDISRTGFKKIKKINKRSHEKESTLSTSCLQAVGFVLKGTYHAHFHAVCLLKYLCMTQRS